MHINEFIADFEIKERFSESELHKAGNQTFLVRDEVARFVKKFPKKAEYAGVLLARQKGSMFIPGRALLERVHAGGAKTIVADKSGAWLWICGKDLWGKSILSTRGEPDVGDKVIVVNEHDEVLGYGKMVRDVGAKSKMVVQRKFDIGDFLRR